MRHSYLKLHELHSKKSAAYLHALDESQWLGHVASLLRAAHRLAHCVHVGHRSVLVHCSDGWDRTSQVCVLVQLLLDPHYRTTRGLATLLDKDVVAFGHKCADRLGFSEHSAAGSTEWSPILLQLLDAILQLVHQFPSAFEYSALALSFLATHAYAGYVHTFTYDTDAERPAAAASGAGRSSVWPAMLERAAHFRNPGYAPWPLERGPLRPACALSRLVVWQLHLVPRRFLAEAVLTEASWCVYRSTRTDPELAGGWGNELHAWCKARVPRTSRGSDTGGEYTLYHIEVELDHDDDGQEAVRFETLRRFSEFQHLDHNVRQHAARDPAALHPSTLALLPPLPSSFTLNKFSASLVASRKASLSAYVSLLASRHDLGSLPEVTAFFGEPAQQQHAALRGAHAGAGRAAA